MGLFSDIASGVATLWNAGASTYNAVKQRHADEANIDRQAKHNRELAEYQFDRNLEMWNLQNEYNSPQSQMRRMTAAGLNPALMYGNISPGNASSPVQYQEAPTDQRVSAKKLPMLDLSNLGAFQELEKRSAEIDTQRELAGYYRAKAAESRENAFWIPGLRRSQIGNYDSSSQNYQASADHHSASADFQRFILSRDQEFLDLDKRIKQLTIESIEKGNSLIDFEKQVKSSLASYYDSVTRKNNGLTPYLVNQAKSDMEEKQYFNKFILPVMYALRKEELQAQLNANTMHQSEFNLKMEKLFAESQQAGVDLEIAREQLKNWQDHGYPFDPASAGMSAIFQSLLDYAKFRMNTINPFKGKKGK